MDEELDNCVDYLSSKEDFNYDEYVQAYDRAMKNARHLFGRHAFRKVYKDTSVNDYRSVINKALFLSWSVLLADFEYEEICQIKKDSWIGELGAAISEDEHYYNMLTYGTNGWKNIIYAFDKAHQIIEMILGL